MPTNTPQHQLKARLREVRAELILDMTEEVLVEKGYQNALIDEIAARAGVAKGTLYQHFPSKEDLIFALFERHFALFEQTVTQTAASSLTASDKLAHILRYVYQERGPRVLLQLLSHNVDIHKVFGGRKVLIHDRFQQCTGRIRIILEEGQAEGSFDPTISAGLMLSAFMSLLTMGRNEQLFAQEQLSPADLAQQVGRIFLAGITVKQ
jgi:AcrR family transcriptional regulator